jgi:hypothetical protein
MKKGIKILLITVLLALVIYNILNKLNERFNWFGGHPEINRTVNSISKVKDGLSPKLLIDKADILKLDGEQKKKIEKLQNDYTVTVSKAKKELMESTEKYQNYLTNNKPEAEKIKSLNKEISRISAVIVTTRAFYWNEACKVLKKEQSKKLDAISTSLTPAERSKYR